MERRNHLIQTGKVTDLVILLGVSIQKMGNMQRLDRKEVSQCNSWQENKFYHAHAASFIAEPSTTALSLPSPDTSSEMWCPGQR